MLLRKQNLPAILLQVFMCFQVVISCTKSPSRPDVTPPPATDTTKSPVTDTTVVKDTVPAQVGYLPVKITVTNLNGRITDTFIYAYDNMKRLMLAQDNTER